MCGMGIHSTGIILFEDNPIYGSINDALDNCGDVFIKIELNYGTSDLIGFACYTTSEQDIRGQNIYYTDKTKQIVSRLECDRTWYTVGKLYNYDDNIYYENTGMVDAPYYLLRDSTLDQFMSIHPFIGTNPLIGTSLGIPAFVDLDNDGDMDFVIGGEAGKLYYYENTGNASHATYTIIEVTPFDGIDVGTYSFPAFVDMDNDGDMDLVIGRGGGDLYYYENTGNATHASYTRRVANPFDGVDVGEKSAPAFVDLDNDGDMDLVIGSQEGDLHYYENTGSASNPSYTGIEGALNPFDVSKVAHVAARSAPAFVDTDDDGDMDLVIGRGYPDDSDLKAYYENTGSASNPSYTRREGALNPFNGIPEVNGFSAAVFVDLDNDGDMDLVLGDRYGSGWWNLDDDQASVKYTTVHAVELEFTPPEYLKNLVFDQNDVNNECCTYTQSCQDDPERWNSCTYPVRNFCGQTCTDDLYNETGSEPSLCCEPKTYRCDHYENLGSHNCGLGFKANTHRCGTDCSTMFNTDVTGSLKSVALTSSDTEVCDGDEQVGVAESECLLTCFSLGYSHYYINDGACHCISSISKRCRSTQKADCSWCSQIHRGSIYISYDYQYTTVVYCDDSGYDYQNCPSGWFWYSGNTEMCIKGSQYNLYRSDCVSSGNCCTPEYNSFSTYEITTPLNYATSGCCDVNNSVSLSSCLISPCPFGYREKTRYNEIVYHTNHTIGCCDAVPAEEICINIQCNTGYKQKGVDYCVGDCTHDMCCAENDNFCTSCSGGFMSTGMNYCNQTCTPDMCCTAMPPCDDSHVCPSSQLVNPSYTCSTVKNGACAPSEYEGGDKCCIPKETCADAYTRLNIAYSDRCYNTAYYDSNSNYKKLDSIVNISGFHRECCKPSCRQLMYERYEGGRGEDTCGDTDGWGKHSWNYDDSQQSDPSATVNDKDWVRKNCCDNSCVKYAAVNDLQCPESMGEVYKYTSTLMYRGVTVSNTAEFEEHCCTYNCQGMYDSGSSCPAGYIRNEKINPTEWTPWQKDRSEAITDFVSACCVPKECHNVAFNKYADSLGTCDSLYGASFIESMYSTVVSHKAECCDIGDCKSAIIGGLTCDNGYVVGTISGVTSDNAASKCCT
jgi:hypothetical protein